MLLVNEGLLMQFLSNQTAVDQQLFNDGIKVDKGIFRNLTDFDPALKGTPLLLEISQYDFRVESLAYFDPLAMVHGNQHLNADEIMRDTLRPLLRQVGLRGLKSFQKAKVWKLRVLELKTSRNYTALLSLGDLKMHYETQLATYFDLENPVTLPDMFELLADYLGFMHVQRGLLGSQVIWRLP